MVSLQKINKFIIILFKYLSLSVNIFVTADLMLHFMNTPFRLFLLFLPIFLYFYIRKISINQKEINTYLFFHIWSFLGFLLAPQFLFWAFLN